MQKKSSWGVTRSKRSSHIFLVPGDLQVPGTSVDVPSDTALRTDPIDPCSYMGPRIQMKAWEAAEANLLIVQRPRDPLMSEDLSCETYGRGVLCFQRSPHRVNCNKLIPVLLRSIARAISRSSLASEVTESLTISLRHGIASPPPNHDYVIQNT